MDSIIHIGSIQVRVTGSGQLRARAIGLDENMGIDLVPLVMTTRPGKVLFRLANFMDQGIQLELKTTEINETFRINRITMNVKPIYTEFPA